MVPSANLLGFAGQELGRKLPHVIGTIIETTLGSLVEIILFMVLISRGNEQIFIIKAAILGSILANLLLCLGTCFFAGGMRRDEQEFHEAVSEVGSNLMLVAGSMLDVFRWIPEPLLTANVVGLIVTTAFSAATGIPSDGAGENANTVVNMSRATAIILIFGYLW